MTNRIKVFLYQRLLYWKVQDTGLQYRDTMHLQGRKRTMSFFTHPKSPRVHSAYFPVKFCRLMILPGLPAGRMETANWLSSTASNVFLLKNSKENRENWEKLTQRTTDHYRPVPSQQMLESVRLIRKDLRYKSWTRAVVWKSISWMHNLRLSCRISDSKALRQRLSDSSLFSFNPHCLPGVDFHMEVSALKLWVLKCSNDSGSDLGLRT